MRVICDKCFQPLTIKDYLCVNCGAEIDKDILAVTFYVHMVEDGIDPNTATDEEVDNWMKNNIK